LTRTAFIYSKKLWERGHGGAHPLKPERLKRTYELLDAYGAFDDEDSLLVPPRPATVEELGFFHSQEYIVAVQKLSLGEEDVNAARYNFGTGDNPVFAGMYETEALKLGAGMVALELVLSGEVEVAFSFAGGMHHARPAYASGFCVFNDIAVAIHKILVEGLRVAYIDIDVHHGDGVQAAFYDNDRVLTISFHESGYYLFPGSGFVEEIGRGVGRGYAVNLPLAPYTDDETYVWAFREIVPPLVQKFEPDIIVTQLGIDTHYQDPLAHLCLTMEGYVAVVETIKDLAPRWLSFGGGGYELDVVPRAWTLAYGVMRGQEFPDEIPSSYAVKYGLTNLRDRKKPFLDDRVKERARRQAEAGVEALKRTVLRSIQGRG
jgi:acetoin utilization protein AcuC